MSAASNSLPGCLLGGELVLDGLDDLVEVLNVGWGDGLADWVEEEPELSTVLGVGGAPDLHWRAERARNDEYRLCVFGYGDVPV
jgi:hypothetical protein